MSTIRLFVAAPLPEVLKLQLKKYHYAFQRAGVRFVPDENLHLTFYFIGNTTTDQLPQIEETLARLATEYQPFELELEVLEPGPKPRNPRLVWARFQEHPAFAALSQDVTTALTGNPEAPQKPIPHITLARFQKNYTFPAMPFLKPEEDITLPVTDLALWQSKLGQPHPAYSVLRSFPLGAGW